MGAPLSQHEEQQIELVRNHIQKRQAEEEQRARLAVASKDDKESLDNPTPSENTQFLKMIKTPFQFSEKEEKEYLIANKNFFDDDSFEKMEDLLAQIELTGAFSAVHQLMQNDQTKEALLKQEGEDFAKKFEQYKEEANKKLQEDSLLFFEKIKSSLSYFEDFFVRIKNALGGFFIKYTEDSGIPLDSNFKEKLNAIHDRAIKIKEKLEKFPISFAGYSLLFNLNLMFFKTNIARIQSAKKSIDQLDLFHHKQKKKAHDEKEKKIKTAWDYIEKRKSQKEDLMNAQENKEISEEKIGLSSGYEQFVDAIKKQEESFLVFLDGRNSKFHNFQDYLQFNPKGKIAFEAFFDEDLTPGKCEERFEKFQMLKTFEDISDVKKFEGFDNVDFQFYFEEMQNEAANDVLRFYNETLWFFLLFKGIEEALLNNPGLLLHSDLKEQLKNITEKILQIQLHARKLDGLFIEKIPNKEPACLINIKFNCSGIIDLARKIDKIENEKEKKKELSGIRPLQDNEQKKENPENAMLKKEEAAYMSMVKNTGPDARGQTEEGKKDLLKHFEKSLEVAKSLDDLYQLFLRLHGNGQDRTLEALRRERGFHRLFGEYGKTHSYQQAMKLLKEKAMQLYTGKLGTDVPQGGWSDLDEQKFTEIFNQHRYRGLELGATRTEKQHQQHKKNKPN